jgi:hypothetical protein
VDEIDRELASALSIEPSPEFRARVRERIAREPAPRSWYLQWRVVGVGVAAVAVAMALVLGRIDPAGSARQPGGPLTERRPLPSTALAGSPVSVLVPQTFGTAVLRPAPRVREPEVLMAPGERRGLRQLEALVREGRAHFVFADEHGRTLSPEPVRDIVIAPIAIAPIEAAAVSESAGNSGGDEQ